MAPSPTTINFPPNVHFLPFPNPRPEIGFGARPETAADDADSDEVSHHEEAKSSSAREGEAPDWHLSAWEKQSAQGQGRCCLNSPLAGEEEEEATPICRIIFKNSKRKHEQYSRHQTSSADSDRSKRISSEDRIKNNRRWAGFHSCENRNMQPEKNN